jgi:hypothetical protein
VREFDTRTGEGGFASTPLSPNETRQFSVFGKNGVPNGATAIALNVTASAPLGESFLTVYPDGPRPLASNLNYSTGVTVANLVIVRLPPSGIIDFYNQNGFVHVVADLAGWYDGNRTTETGRFVPLAPTRLFDTRDTGSPLGSGETRVFPVAGHGGVPTAGTGTVVMNVTATAPTTSGYVTVHPDGTYPTPTSTLNFAPGQVVPNLVYGRLGTSGNIRIYNFAGSTQVIGDVAGYFTEVTFGFDTCETPSVNQMSAWRLASPYTSIGIYIGGVNRACANTALNSTTWFNTVAGQGWRFIPIYVGLQAPCSGFAQRIDPANAFYPGIAAADDAVSRATAAGLPGGVPIYLDMEYYNYTITSCSNAVRSFVQGWVTQLHARGYRAGFYSSLAGGIADMVGAVNAGYTPVDAIWIAAWNGTPNIYGFSPQYLPDQNWVFAQRIHQYNGGHDETWGGVTLNIDNNAVFGPLAP